MTELVPTYKINELCEMDNRNYRTIKNSPKYSQWYIPVKFENASARGRKKMWIQKTDYTIKYIRLKDLKEYFEKKTWKKLVLIDKE